MDKYGYPEEHELNTIRNWPLESHADAMKLVGYIRERWQYADYFYFQMYERPKGWNVQISTAGWSGNESIIEALQSNPVFWGLYWRMSRAGGHYTFFIPKETEK